MAGFIDYLTADMTLLIVVDVVICQMVYSTLGRDFSRMKEDEETSDRLRAFGYMLLGLAFPLLVLGLAMDTTWPLPSSYNFIFGDLIIYLGSIVLVSGLLMLKSPENVRLLFPLIAVFSLFVLVYGANILYYNLGQNPLAAAAMMFAEGLGGMSTSMYLLTSKRLVGYITITLLAVAIVILVITNVESVFDHTVSFKSWLP